MHAFLCRMLPPSSSTDAMDLDKLPSSSPSEASLDAEECGTRQNSFDDLVPDSTDSRADSGSSSEVEEDSPFWHLLAALPKRSKMQYVKDEWSCSGKSPKSPSSLDNVRVKRPSNKGSSRCARNVTPLSDQRLAGLDGERQFNMAAEIRTYVRTLGPFLLSSDYRRLRAEVRQLGMRETDEALEFVRRYFTIDVLSQAALPLSIDLADLSRAAQGAVLCSRKLCFSSDIWIPADFNKEEHSWFGYQVAGVGKRLAMAFAQHFLPSDTVGCPRLQTQTGCPAATPAAAAVPQPTRLSPAVLPSIQALMPATGAAWNMDMQQKSMLDFPFRAHTAELAF